MSEVATKIHATFKVNITTYGEYDGSPEDWAEVPIDERLLERIKTLSALVKEHKLYCTREFDYTPDYHWVMETRTECDQLVVCDDRFYWRGYYKNGDTPFETGSIMIADLLAAEPGAVIDQRNADFDYDGEDEDEDA